MDVEVTVSVPAAAKKLVDGLIQVVADLKAGKGWVAVAADAEPIVVGAIGSLSELESEMSDPQLAVLGGLFAGQLIQALKSAPAVAPAPAAPSA